jgi:integral membrane protein
VTDPAARPADRSADPVPAKTSGQPPGKARAIGGALTRFRVMAIVTGTGLVILTFVGIPLQIWADNDKVVAIVGTAHGYLYLVYLAVTADLALRLRWPLLRILLIAIAGTVPFCSFIAERKVTARVRAEQSAGSIP